MATYTQRTIRDPLLLQAAIEALDARVTVVGSEGVDEATLNVVREILRRELPGLEEAEPE